MRPLAVGLAGLGLAAVAHWSALAQEQLPTCNGQPATIVGTPGPDRIIGTPGRDVIYADAGDDVVSGEGTGDVICGGLDNDTIGGGSGNDRLFGEDGTDTLGGDRGNDRLDGGAGDGDRLRGGLGDDRGDGGLGNGDEVVGDLGIDVVSGGDGDGDLVRGDSGADTMRGGPGVNDVASFATASARAYARSRRNRRIGTNGSAAVGVRASLATGIASGDGRDTLAEFEDLEGSAFDDGLIGDGADNQLAGGPGDDDLDGGGGTDSTFGGPGADRCVAFTTAVSCGKSRIPPDAPLAQGVPSLAGGGGLVVAGSSAGDRLTISVQPNGSFLVRSADPIAPGAGCTPLAPSRRSVVCATRTPVRYLMVDSKGGADRINLGAGLLLPSAVRVAAGAGDDVVRAGEEDDLIETGSGSDRLFGGAGSDGFLASSPGPDLLDGGPGDDLLIAGGPCVGGRLVGGDGDDNASFARTPSPRGVMQASLEAGEAFVVGAEGCQNVGIDASVEDLEGTFGRDILIGDAGDNGFFGQRGADEFYGRDGNDLLNARDGVADLVIDCGPGDADTAVVDPTDPPPVDCEPSPAARIASTPHLGAPGSFKGKTSQRQLFTFRLRARGRRIDKGVFDWIADCRVAATRGYRSGTTFDARVPADGRFSVSGTYREDLDAGHTTTISLHLRGWFPKEKRARGTFRVRPTVRDVNGEVVDRCDSGRVAWYAVRRGSGRSPQSSESSSSDSSPTTSKPRSS